MSFVKLGARAGRIARDVLPARRNMSQIETYTVANRITLYEVPNLTTPGDIRRAIAGRVEGVVDVKIDYKAFRPSGKAMITLETPEQLARAIRSLTPLTVCGSELRAVAHYSPEYTQLSRMRGVKGLKEAIERGAIAGNGPGGSFPNVERNVVLWGMPGKVTVDEVARALTNFKTAKKNGKPIIVKIERLEGQFSVFSRFVVTMASISDARHLVRAWHMTPWNVSSTEPIRAQVLF